MSLTFIVSNNSGPNDTSIASIVKLPKSRPGNVEYFKLLGCKCDLYGLERQISLVAIKSTLSNFQNPRWQPSDLDFGKIFNF